MGLRHTINIDLDKKCAECGKGGAVDSGICLACTIKVFGKAKLKSTQAQAIRARLRGARPATPMHSVAVATREG